MINISELPHFMLAPLMVVGDVMLDSYWTGVTHRVSPEAPVPIVKMQRCDTRPGGAANVAFNLAMLGCPVTLLGAVGRDDEGLELTKQLEEKGVTCHFQFISEGRTINKLRVMAHHQQMLRLDFEPQVVEYNDQALLTVFQKQLPHVKAILLSDYGKGTLGHVQRFITLARQQQVPIFIDPKGHDYSIYAGATMITPNLAEFEAVVGHCGNNEALIVTKAQALIKQHAFSAVLVTRGHDGMSLIFADQRPALHLPAYACEVFDVTGAGDTVIAVLSAAIAGGLDYQQATYLANLAASLVVRKLGTSHVTLAELRDELRNTLGIARGIFSEKELLSIVHDAKLKGEKIVMTNGCFDILHPGHIQYLAQAKALGERLIVAVNTDDSVARLKGAARPVNTLAARMEMLSALRMVDWVVPFAEETPERLINAILPHVLVKGGDYHPTQVIGRDAVIANNGEVIILPFREGYSTTRLIEKIKVEI